MHGVVMGHPLPLARVDGGDMPATTRRLLSIPLLFPGSPPTRRMHVDASRAQAKRGAPSTSGMDGCQCVGIGLLEEEEAAMLHSGMVNGIHMEWADACVDTYAVPQLCQPPVYRTHLRHRAACPGRGATVRTYRGTTGVPWHHRPTRR